MDEHGKIIDVLVNDSTGRDPATGMPKLFGFVVWADLGMTEVIKAIPGIQKCEGYGTCYYVDLDPRYDREFLRQEIIARVKINEVKDEQK